VQNPQTGEGKVLYGNEQLTYTAPAPKQPPVRMDDGRPALEAVTRKRTEMETCD